MQKNLLALAIAIPVTVALFAILFLCTYVLSSLNVYDYERFILALVALFAVIFFGILYVTVRSKGILIGAVCWLLYAIYEFGMNIGVHYGDPQIRLDLFFVLPALFFFSFVGMWSFLLQWTQGREKIK